VWVSGVGTNGMTYTWSPRFAGSATHSPLHPELVPVPPGKWGMQAAMPDFGSLSTAVALPRWVRKDGLARAPAECSTPSTALDQIQSMPSDMLILSGPPATGSVDTEDASAPVCVALSSETPAAHSQTKTIPVLHACDSSSGEFLGVDRRVLRTARARGEFKASNSAKLEMHSADDVLLVLQHAKSGESVGRLRLYSMLSICEQAQAFAREKRAEIDAAERNRRRLSSSGLQSRISAGRSSPDGRVSR